MFYSGTPLVSTFWDLARAPSEPESPRDPTRLALFSLIFISAGSAGSLVSNMFIGVSCGGRTVWGTVALVCEGRSGGADGAESILAMSTAARYSDSCSVVCVEAGAPACDGPRGKIWLTCSWISIVYAFCPDPLEPPDFSEASAASSLISSVIELSILKWLNEVRFWG